MSLYFILFFYVFFFQHFHILITPTHPFNAEIRIVKEQCATVKSITKNVD